MYKKILFFTLFIMLLVPNVLMAQTTYQMEFYWKHSGVGIDKFIIDQSLTSGGPWEQGAVLMVEDLEQGEDNQWTGEATIDVPDGAVIIYFTIYAQSPSGMNSARSNETMIDLTVPDAPYEFKIKVTFI